MNRPSPIIPLLPAEIDYEYLIPTLPTYLRSTSLAEPHNYMYLLLVLSTRASKFASRQRPCSPRCYRRELTQLLGTSSVPCVSVTLGKHILHSHAFDCFTDAYLGPTGMIVGDR